ncbi:alpha-amylase family glycosyl hydrolase [Gracilibacillus salinarum]|uniref:Alpha-amylase family glycosyl hydrolase n=1 Tax=Gracilibacillus salinarum TaxID=2932255 RepID=A0ABY4GRE5_9BACI|nr:alpha-amylase family glycosyl hydrolase [Gracilibacillus salinarum]UOQ86540.1 alpha-amylase family glycosyl hydrolase [Gracilibacillus salinarum]
MYYIKRILAISVLLLLIMPSISVMAEEQPSEQIYYLLVDRFVNGDNSNDININIDDPSAYYGGDLQGVTDKLDHFNELGISMINLSPIMSAQSYHGFDTSDFQTVNEQFGDIADLQNLVKKAHEQDIEVILDLPLTHVATTHPWVQEPSDWQSGNTVDVFGQSLPGLDLTNDDLQNYFIETAVHWLTSADIDGFHIYVDQDTPASFIEELRARLQQENEDVTLIVDGSETESAMNHSFKSEATEILKQPGESLESLVTSDSGGVHYMESAFTNRFTHEAVQAGFHPVTRWKLASTLLYTLPGSSLLYQGIEVPMDNGKAEPDHRMAQVNNNDEELMQHLQKLAQIRSQSSSLQQGDLEVVGQQGAMIVYKRSDQNETMYIAINNDTETQSVSLEGLGDDMQLRGLLDDNIVRKQEDGTYRLILDRETSNIFVLEENTGFNWIFIAMMVFIFGGFISFIVAVNRRSKKNKQAN